MIGTQFLNRKMPNMDLIEDVSRASQNLTNELLNTNTGFTQAREEENVVMQNPQVT